MSPGPAPTPESLAEARQPKLLERMRSHLRTRHYSLRTEQAYIDGARRFLHPVARQAPPAGYGCSRGRSIPEPLGCGKAGFRIHAEPSQGGDSVFLPAGREGDVI